MHLVTSKTSRWKRIFGLATKAGYLQQDITLVIDYIFTSPKQQSLILGVTV